MKFGTGIDDDEQWLSNYFEVCKSSYNKLA